MIRSTLSILLATIAITFIACNTVAENNNRGNALTNSSKFSQAIQAYSSAQVTDPDNPIPYLNAAHAYFENGNLLMAVEVLEQAILRGDDTLKTQAYYNLGNFYFLSDEYENAIQAYREALILDADNDHARQNLELAMLYRNTPTPSDDEMKTEPDQNQVDPTSLPTNQPLDFDGPTPTPPPIDFNEEEDPEGGVTGENFGNQTEGTPSPREEATLSIPEAQELLDPIKQSQSIYGEFSDEVATPTNSDSLKDW